MKQLIIYLAVIYLSILSSFAQMKKMENAANFVKQIEQNVSSVKSFESDFRQTKHIEAFNQDITSSGKFYYRANGKITLNYLTPLPYLIEISGDTIKLESDGKKNVMPLKNNKMLKEMNSIILACITGKFSNISNDYRMEFYENEQSYLITVIPVNENIKKYITQFDIYFNKKEISVDKLRISETKGDYTEYYFSNKKFNPSHSIKS